ncbi:MAG: aldo/keto reductase [Candidatus Coatesbacteria bacterium]
MAKKTSSAKTPSFKADRYDAVPKGWFRPCGRSGLKLPAISLGCWHNFGGAGTGASGIKAEKPFHDHCRAMLRTAFDLGITHFDLANNYGPPAGAAEERVGRILADDFRAHRNELVISSKAGWGMWPGPYGDLGSRKYLIASLDESLKRLRVDYVDIFYHHRPDPDTPIEETMSALDTAIRQGKVLYGGISSYSGAETRKAVEACEKNGFFKPIIHQPSYSMLDRWIEPDLLPVTEKLGLGVIAFCPLAQGKLTGKYLKGIPKDSRAASDSPFLGKDSVTGKAMEQVRRLNEVAAARGQTLAQMALAWVVRTGAATSALIGASRPEQIVENVQALKNVKFSADELKKIDAIVR